MTQFEFVGVGVSIVIALAVARLLEGARDAFDPQRRYWIHCLWLINKLMNTMLLYWGGWVYKGVTSWNFLEYIILLGAPAVVFLQAHALVTPYPDKVKDWSEHFWGIRRMFFGCNVFLITFSAITIYVVAETPFPSRDLIPISIVYALSIVGFFSTNARAHGVIVILAFLNLCLGFGVRFMGAA
jgi:hypothetical protein